MYRCFPVPVSVTRCPGVSVAHELRSATKNSCELERGWNVAVALIREPPDDLVDAHGSVMLGHAARDLVNEASSSSLHSSPSAFGQSQGLVFGSVMSH